MEWFGWAYFWEYTLSTKNLLKFLSVLNIILIMWLISRAVFGYTVTDFQVSAAFMCVLVIFACFVYRWVVLSD